MAITWTEAFSSFTPAGTNWQDYDLYTNKGVSKGAVAFIVCSNGNDGTDVSLGVRTDGSGLARYVLLHEAEGGGVTTVEMYVTCHADTGLIETYCSTTTAVTYYLMGYWTGVTFTEMFVNPPTDYPMYGAYNGYHLYDDYGVPKGAVCQFYVYSGLNDILFTSGVTGGSSFNLNRKLPIHEAEGGSPQPTNGYSVCVKSTVADGYVLTIWPIYIAFLGYFDSSMDYVEAWVENTALQSGDDGVWTDWDLTSYLDEDGRVVDLVLTHEDKQQETFLGARINGGADLDRRIEEHEAESNGQTGFNCPTQTDANGIVEVRCEDASESHFYFAGYFLEAAAAGQTVSLTDTFSLKDSFSLSTSRYRNILETTNMLDQLSSCTFKFCNILETTNMLDQLSSYASRYIPILETTSLLDKFSRNNVLSRLLQDYMSHYDVVSRQEIISRQIQDALSFYDLKTRESVISRFIIDTASFPDLLAVSAYKRLSLQDAYSLYDLISASLAAGGATYSVSIYDTSSILDSFSPITFRRNLLLDTLSLEDQFSRNNVLSRLLQDVFSFYDLKTRESVISRFIIDTASFPELLAFSTYKTVVLQDYMSHYDVVSRQEIISRQIQDTYSLYDLVSTVRTHYVSVSITDRYSIIDSFSKINVISRLLQDNSTYLDTYELYSIKNRLLQDQLSLYDTLSLQRLIRLTLQDITSLLDQASFASILNRFVADTSSFPESFTSYNIINRYLQDKLSHYDAFSRSITEAAIPDVYIWRIINLRFDQA